jgi:hypothetical protein
MFPAAISAKFLQQVATSLKEGRVMASVSYCFYRSCQALGISLLTMIIALASLAWLTGLVTG